MQGPLLAPALQQLLLGGQLIQGRGQALGGVAETLGGGQPLQFPQECRLPALLGRQRGAVEAQILGPGGAFQPAADRAGAVEPVLIEGVCQLQ